MKEKLNYKELGKKIKEIRKSKGLTQKDLANQINKNISSIRKYEYGLVKIPESNIKILNSVLGVDLLNGGAPLPQESLMIEKRIELEEAKEELIKIQQELLKKQRIYIECLLDKLYK